jgi:hypothetical protein
MIALTARSRDGNRVHYQVSLPAQFVEDDLSLGRDESRNAFGA